MNKATKQQRRFVAELAEEPRTVVVVCTKDGSSRKLLDDGGAFTADGFQPNAARQRLLANLSKLNKAGEPVFVLEEGQEPLFPGDGVARFPALYPAGKGKKPNDRVAKLIDAGVEERTTRLARAERQAHQQLRANSLKADDNEAPKSVAAVGDVKPPASPGDP